ncbi:MAG: pyruvate dehydrogenase (acetyl-transferring) E1 component subunit alpha [Spirochaetaceae bacterium]|nr:MAG: pyruvate dehydrogenase (acetyl-transferring) E1 component subunit alpha [Spirochaetaceae bacterium]
MAKRETKVDVFTVDGVGDHKKEFLVELLRQMTLIRRFEEKAAQMYGLRKIGGFCHLYNGQEAVAVGAISALDLKHDYVLTAYRDHGHALAVGMEPNAIMAELYGKITGCSRGKGGSMHMFDAEKHFLGGNGIVGAQIPMATGTAFAQMYWKKVMGEKKTGVTLCFFGDGAIHQGAFHESLNLAAVWKLPAIYIVENNQFGMGTAVHRVSSVEDFEIKATGFDMPGMTIDGMNVIAVHDGIKKAREQAQADETPILIDIKTYRYKGHSMSDPAKYRTREQLEQFQQQDPILVLKAMMIDAKMINDDEYKKIDDDVKKVVNESIEFAENSDEPPVDTMYEDIYA